MENRLGQMKLEKKGGKDIKHYYSVSGTIEGIWATMAAVGVSRRAQTGDAKEVELNDYILEDVNERERGVWDDS